MTVCPISPELLSAYVDSELPPETASAVADHLGTCGRCSSDYQALLVTVAALRSGLVRHAAPDMLRARVRSAIAEAPRPMEPSSTADDVRGRPGVGWRAAVLAAAAVACIGLGSSATLIVLHRAAPSSVVAEQVLASHVRSLMLDHLTDVRSSDQHNVKPWFNGRLDFSPAVPRLEEAGFPLIGGRLDYVADRPVASVVYGRRQHIINVFSWPTSAADSPLESTASHGYNMLHWRARGVEQWVVSDVNMADLRTFVGLLQRSQSDGAER